MIEEKETPETTLQQNQRYRITLKGKVQGIFMRENIKKRAIELGLNGWVRNKGTDEVELVVEGEKIFLDKLYQFCKEGTERAKVLGANVEKEIPTGEFDGFSIRF